MASSPLSPAARRITGKQLARLLGTLPAEPPQYAALAHGVQELLLTGHIPLSARLPAERELALVLNVSRTTITAAYDRLRAEGYVESRPGSGSFTATPSPGKRGGPWPHASTGQIDLSIAAAPATRLLPEAIAAATLELPCYLGGTGYSAAGLAVLRERIARHYSALGADTHADQIFVTAGSQHALSLIFRELLRAGDTTLVESPTYPHAMSAARAAGGRLVPVGLHPKTGWDLELIEQTLRQTAARVAYLIPDYQNPTGLCMDNATRRALVETARRTGTQLIIDETFFGIRFDDAKQSPPVASFDTDGRVISVGALSKIAWGGLRIGWIRATPALTERLNRARAEYDLASPVLEQLIAVELLDRYPELILERRAFASQRDALIAALREHEPHWRFVIPRGGLNLWVELEAAISSPLAASAAHYGVHVVPGSFFSADGLLERYLRLPFAHPPALLRDAVARLSRAHQELQNSRPETLQPRYRPVV